MDQMRTTPYKYYSECRFTNERVHTSKNIEEIIKQKMFYTNK